MNHLRTVVELGELDFDFGEKLQGYAVTNLEFTCAWRELISALVDMEHAGDKGVFTAKLAWWEGLISYLEKQLAEAKAEWANDPEGEWHWVSLEDFSAHQQRQLDAAYQVRGIINKRLEMLYGN